MYVINSLFIFTDSSTLKGMVIEEEEGSDSVIQKYPGQLILLLQDLLKNVIR